MKAPMRTPARHAADCSFLLRQAALAAKECEDKAHTPGARKRAAQIKVLAYQLRRAARELERGLA